MSPTRKRPVTRSGTPRRRKGIKLKPTELRPGDLLVTEPDAAVRELLRKLADDGGQALSVYREPLGGNVQIFAALPIEKVEPTPFQRDVSDSHVRRLTLAMDKTRRYLDPIIAVREEGGLYRTPNGGHRLTALKELGARTIPALLVPDPAVAFQILALNIEKAHNLREKSLEVARMYEELVKLDPSRPEKDCALEFEEPQLITLGLAYQRRGRFSGGAYQPALKKVEGFLSQPLPKARQIREQRTGRLLSLDDAVIEVVQKLKDRGLVSPYLKAFVVARINPLRFMKGALPSFDELLETMTKRARGMNPDRIKATDLSRTGGAPDEE